MGQIEGSDTYALISWCWLTDDKSETTCLLLDGTEITAAHSYCYDGDHTKYETALLECPSNQKLWI